MGDVTDALRRAGHESVPRLRERDAEAEVDTTPCPIPRTLEGAWQARAVLVGPPGLQVDQLRHFALRVRRSLEERGARSVLVTSALQGEGKTLVACNLALALASIAGESRIALLDLDLHQPNVANAMGIAPGTGVERFLLGEASLRSARIRTDLPALDLFPIARPVPRAHEILASPSFPSLIQELSRQYAMIVCDSPPVLLTTDVELIAPQVGACLVVAKAGVTRRLAFLEAIAMLPRENLIGTFLNFSNLPRYARNYSRYGYDDGSQGVSNGIEATDRADDRNPLTAETALREPPGRSDG